MRKLTAWCVRKLGNVYAQFSQHCQLMAAVFFKARSLDSFIGVTMQASVVCCICDHKSWSAFKLKAKFNQRFSQLQRRKRRSKLTKREIPSLRALSTWTVDRISLRGFHWYERQGRTAKQNLFSMGSTKSSSNIEPRLYFHLYMFDSDSVEYKPQAIRSWKH